MFGVVRYHPEEQLCTPLSSQATMQVDTSEETSKSGSSVEDVPSQLIRMASGSLTNATKQLTLVVEGRLKNLKVCYVTVDFVVWFVSSY